MKTIINLLVMTSFVVIPPEAHAMFGHVAIEKDRRQQVEQQLNQSKQQLSQSQQQLGEQQRLAREQQRITGELQQTIGGQQRAVTEQSKLTNKWQTLALALGISSVVLLIVGTAIGSRGRRYATTEK